MDAVIGLELFFLSFPGLFLWCRGLTPGLRVRKQ